MFKKRCINSFLLVVLILLIFPLIYAQQPPPAPQTNININVGLQIEFTQISVFENSKDHIFNVHVFNISTGKKVDDVTTECFFHLFDNTGFHVINQLSMPFDSVGLDWDLNITGGNFTRNGLYSSLVVCSADDIGGFASVGFIVTQTGDQLTESISMIYFILTLGVFGIFLLTLWGAIVLPMKNPRGGLDEIVDVSILKYFKLGLMFLSYTLFMWLINLLLTLSNNFIILSQYLGFFTMMFVILRSFIWPLFVIMWATFTFLAWKDLQLIKLLERGLSPK